MKLYLIIFCLAQVYYAPAQLQLQKTENIFIITIDGVRWQEIFNGADPALISNVSFTADTSLAKQMFWDESPIERKKKLMPFFWNVIDKTGQLYGNRLYNNKMNVANIYKFSYPGYNEIFTGYADLRVNSNKPREDTNTNILEFLNDQEAFKERVVAFTSWSIFPFILGTKRNGLPVFSGYTSLPDSNTNETADLINKVQNNLSSNKMATRYDQLTFLVATEYIQQHQPKIVFISFGEADESAHRGEYNQYLQQINNADRMISQLWYFIQSNKNYRNKTALLITTDHGRGKNGDKWKDHDILKAGSGQTWLALIGPGIKALGEMKDRQQLYQKQIANSIASLLGLTFTAEHPVGKAIRFQLSPQ